MLSFGMATTGSNVTGAETELDAAAAVSGRSVDLLLDEMDRRGKRWLWLGLAWLAVLVVILVAVPSSEGRNVVRLIALVLGPAYTYLGVAWMRVLPKAREALATTPIPARLETKVRHGYAFRRYLNAQLWRPNDSERPLARFSETLLRTLPRYLDVKLTPASVYGEPAEGAVVVVVCQQGGVLVGRINQSNYQPH